MSTEQNKALVRRVMEEVISRGNMCLADEVVAPDCVAHPFRPGIPPGPEGFRMTVTIYRGAFPDFKAAIHDMIAEGDKIAVRMTHSGTHTGDFMGIPPTGKSVSFEEIAILRIADGKVAEYWGQADSMGMMQQLGAMPAPGASGS